MQPSILKAYVAAAKRLFREEMKTREKTRVHELAVKLEITEAKIKELWDQA